MSEWSSSSSEPMITPTFPTVAETIEVLHTIHERPGTSRVGIYDKLEDLAIAHLEQAFLPCRRKEGQ